MSIKVLTWNIAHQSTLPKEMQSLLDWPTRLESILQTLQSSDADVIMLQEVNLDTLRTDFKQLEAKYDCVAHTRNKKRTNVFGNATFWSRAFTHLGTTMGSRVLHIKLMVTRSGASVVGIPVTISNVHLPAMNGYSGYLEKLTHLRSCVKNWKNDSPIIFGGDFNDSFTFQCGLLVDLSAIGFHCADGELGKQSCKSFRTGNVYNVDHILVFGDLTITLIPSRIDAKTIPSRENPSDHTPAVYNICVKDEEPESSRASQNKSNRFVINVLEKIRKHAPFPRGICDIIASYSMSYGDLLAYMPYVWEQDDDEPYEYPHSVFGSGRVYCSGTYIRPEFDLWESRDYIELELAGVDDLLSLLADSYPLNHDSDIPDAEMKKISDYYEQIARRCLGKLLKARTE